MGLSGGIDSALSAAVAVDAIGSENVHCVMMPSPFTSQESLEDAAEIAGILGVAYDIIPIHEAMTAFDRMLTSVFQKLRSRRHGRKYSSACSRYDSYGTFE